MNSPYWQDLSHELFSYLRARDALAMGAVNKLWHTRLYEFAEKWCETKEKYFEAMCFCVDCKPFFLNSYVRFEGERCYKPYQYVCARCFSPVEHIAECIRCKDGYMLPRAALKRALVGPCIVLTIIACAFLHRQTLKIRF